MIHNCWVMAIGNRHDMAETPHSSSRSTPRCATSTPRAPASRPTRSQDDGRRDLAVGSAAIERASPTRCCGRQGHAGRQDQGEDRRVNEVRAMELQLMASGLSRSQARERINKIKGTPGAAPEAGTTDSAGAELVGRCPASCKPSAHRSIRMKKIPSPALAGRSGAARRVAAARRRDRPEGADRGAQHGFRRVQGAERCAPEAARRPRRGSDHGRAGREDQRPPRRAAKALEKTRPRSSPRRSSAAAAPDITPEAKEHARPSTPGSARATSRRAACASSRSRPR
jgi:hypothetical protein